MESKGTPWEVDEAATEELLFDVNVDVDSEEDDIVGPACIDDGVLFVGKVVGEVFVRSGQEGVICSEESKVAESAVFVYEDGLGESGTLTAVDESWFVPELIDDAG